MTALRRTRTGDHTVGDAVTLDLDMPVMDATHQEFVDLLAAVVYATDDLLLPRWSALIAHTQDHFDREDQWMQSTRFSSAHIHSTQHKVVLQVMREGLSAGESGELAPIRNMASELGQWFANHAQSMDAALALHLRKTGYEPSTGVLSMPETC